MTNCCSCTAPNDIQSASDAQIETKISHVADGAFSIRESLATGQKALHAGKAFQAGEVLSEISFRARVPTPTYLSVQFGEVEHGMLYPVHLEYINHSCSPNVFFDVNALHLRALRPIAPGEELCFFYPSTEWTMTQSFHCHCNSTGCLGYIQGAAYLPEHVLDEYEFSGHIKKLMQRGMAA